MIGHQHVLVPDLLVDLGEVDAALVWKRFHKVELVSENIAEVDIKDLVSTPEPPDYIGKLGTGVIEHLVEFLHPVDRA
jgi:hypothetical protein